VIVTSKMSARPRLRRHRASDPCGSGATNVTHILCPRHSWVRSYEHDVCNYVCNIRGLGATNVTCVLWLQPPWVGSNKGGATQGETVTKVTRAACKYEGGHYWHGDKKFKSQHRSQELNISPQ